MRFVSADYAQIELAILAYLSKDPILLDAFAQGKDVHRQTASLIFGVAGGPGHPRAAPGRQDDQLRRGLRHVLLRPGAEPEDPARGRGPLHHDVLPALPGRGQVPEGDHQVRRGDRVRADAHGPPPPGARPSRSSNRTEKTAARAGRGELTHPGHRGGHREARHGEAVPPAWRERGSPRASSCRCTTRSSWRRRSRRRRPWRASCARSWST